MNRGDLKFAYVVALTVAIGGIGFLFNNLGILLALIPSAYFLALFPSDKWTPARNVLVIHLIAVIAGMLAYYLLIGDTNPFDLAPMSESGFRVVVGLMLAVTVTRIALFALNERIPTAHATATVVGLGITTSLLSVGGLLLGIGVMSGLHALYRDRGDCISEPRT